MTHPTFSNYIFWTGLFSILAKALLSSDTYINTLFYHISGDDILRAKPFKDFTKVQCDKMTVKVFDINVENSWTIFIWSTTSRKSIALKDFKETVKFDLRKMSLQFWCGFQQKIALKCEYVIGVDQLCLITLHMLLISY